MKILQLQNLGISRYLMFFFLLMTRWRSAEVPNYARPASASLLWSGLLDEMETSSYGLDAQCGFDHQGHPREEGRSSLERSAWEVI
ncbi:hypothetical protein QQ045_026407 [Rhodiola kirilowii]